METTTSRIMEGAKHAQSFLSCRIKLKTKRPADQLIFDELWIEDRLYNIKITNEENQEVDNQFTKKQILFIEVESEVSQHSAIPPAEKKGSKIFIGYQVDNKRKYFPIDDFSEEAPQRSVA
jgi:hypothetical protein